jgi:drug/metabolite transporter (DMT)-like permease
MRPARTGVLRDLTGLPPLAEVFAAAVLWSTGGVFIKSTSLSAVEIACGRSLLAAVTVGWLTRRDGWGINPVTATAAVLYAALLLLFVMATKLTTAANAIFLQYTAPIYILLLEPLLTGERRRARDGVVVAVCVAGMALFFVGELRPRDVSGNLAALASGLCFALFALSLRHPRAAEVNRASAVIYGNLLLAAATAPAFFAGTGLGIGGADAARLLFLGVVQIGLAYTLFTRGIARGVRSLDAGIVGYVEPVLNPVWVFLFVGERPAPGAIVGGAIILGAVAFHAAATARAGAR